MKVQYLYDGRKKERERKEIYKHTPYAHETMKRWSRILAGALEGVQEDDRWLVCNSEGPQGCGSRDDKHLRSSSEKKIKIHPSPVNCN